MMWQFRYLYWMDRGNQKVFSLNEEQSPSKILQHCIRWTFLLLQRPTLALIFILLISESNMNFVACSIENTQSSPPSQYWYIEGAEEFEEKIINETESYFKEKRVMEAITYLRNVLMRYENSSVSHFLLGEALQKKGNNNEAIKSYITSFEKDPYFKPPYFAAREIFFRSAEWQKGINLLETMIQFHPEDAFAFYNLGLAYQKTGKMTKSVSAFRKSVQLDPTYANSRFKLGYYLFKADQYPEAKKHFEKILELDPKFVQATINLAGINYNQRNRKQAIEFYLQSLYIMKNDEVIYQNLGDLHLMEQIYDKAIQYLKIAVKMNPDNEYAYLRLGIAYYNVNQFQECLKCLKKYTKKYPQNTQVYKLMFRAFFHLKSTANATFDQIQILQLDAYCADSAFQLGKLFMKKYNFNEAIKYFRKAVQINPKYRLGYYQLAVALVQIRNFRQSIKTLIKVFEIDPDFQKAHFYMGYNYFQLNLLNQAFRAYENAIEIDPGSQIAFQSYINLAHLSEQKQKRENVYNYLHKAVEIGSNKQEPLWSLSGLFQRWGGPKKIQQTIDRIKKFADDEVVAFYLEKFREMLAKSV